MPWHVVEDHAECPASKPWAVVKDSDESVAGCHESKQEAQAQVAALYAREDEMSMADTTTTRRGWSGVLAIEGQETGDGRILAVNSLSWRDLPLTLLYQKEQPPMGIGNMNPHAGARIVGSVENIWRDEADPHVIRGSGLIGSSDEAQAFAQDLSEGNVKGVSVDMDDVTAEWLAVESDDPDDEVYQVNQARIMGATACAFPALMGAEIQVVALAIGDAEADEPHAFEDSGDGTCKVCGKTKDEHGEDGMPKPSDEGAAVDPTRAGMLARHLDHHGYPEPERIAEAVVAAGIMYPPESWYEPPVLDGPAALRITEDGEVVGHAFLWDTPHMALAGRTAPRSASGYAYFRTGSRRVRCDCGDGSWAEIPTGTITLGTSHFRDLKGDARAALDHYEHTGLGVADVAMGEDEYGGWVHGALRPDVPDERLVELRGASLSGDWRWIGGRLELVALLAVNVPGFAIPRTAFHESEDRVTALVAAGVVPPGDVRVSVDLDALYRRMAALEARQRYLDPLVTRAAVERLGL